MSNILGIGIDIIEIERIRDLIEISGSRFQRKHFTPVEINYCDNKTNRYQHYAGKFSAKEAVCKALGMGWKDGMNWKDIQILNDEKGRPKVVFAGKAEQKSKALGVDNVFISISHCNKYATAVAILTGEG